MKKPVLLMVVLVGAAMTLRRLSQMPGTMRDRMTERMMERMRRMMEGMPEDSPPKLFMSSMRRREEQNQELLALMREQNALLRESLAAGESSPSA